MENSHDLSSRDSTSQVVATLGGGQVTGWHTRVQVVRVVVVACNGASDPLWAGVISTNECYQASSGESLKHMDLKLSEGTWLGQIQLMEIQDEFGRIFEFRGQDP